MARKLPYPPEKTVENELIEIKKNDKENYSKVRRFLDLHYEIYRLELTLYNGYISKEMANYNTKKLLILENEMNNIWRFFIKMDRENTMKQYYFNFLEKYKYKDFELEIRFKCKKCKYCDLQIIDFNEISCSDCEEEFNLL